MNHSIKNIRIYSPDSALKRPGMLVQNMFTDLIASRELAFALAKRDISTQFRQSILGYAWAFLPIIATTGVFLFLKAGGAFETANANIPYPLYVLVGTIYWHIFVDAVNGPLKVVNTCRDMIVKINFPREALILAAILITLFNILIRLFILVPALVFFAWKGMYYFTWISIPLFLIGTLGIILLGYAIGLLLTPIGMLYKDVQMGIQMIMMFWMFISPVVMAIPASGMVAVVMKTNPVTPVLDTARAWLLSVHTEFLQEFWVVLGISALFILVGWLLYRIAMPHVIARLGM